MWRDPSGKFVIDRSGIVLGSVVLIVLVVAGMAPISAAPRNEALVQKEVLWYTDREAYMEALAARSGEIPKSGSDLTWYLDREAYTRALDETETAIRMSQPDAPKTARQDLELALERIEGARTTFASGEMIASLRDAHQAIEKVEIAEGKGAVLLAEPDSLVFSIGRATHEIVQTIYGFTYESQPHIVNARRTLDSADSLAASGRFAVAANLFRVAVDQAKTSLEGKNMYPPKADAETVKILDKWAIFREGELRGDTALLLRGVHPFPQIQERFIEDYDGLSSNEEIRKLAITDQTPLIPDTRMIEEVPTDADWERWIARAGSNEEELEKILDRRSKGYTDGYCCQRYYWLFGPLGKQPRFRFCVSFIEDEDGEWWIESL